MGKKIFVSYKYGDTLVRQIHGSYNTKVRDYVDLLQLGLDEEDHINKGENDDESLEGFKESTIASKLRDKIYDSSITIIVISKGMKEAGKSEDEQWIPWEISYSLSEYTRNDTISRTNGVLAVVLPDETGSYEYFLVDNHCANCNSRLVKTNFLFKILKENMFNIKEPKYSSCQNHQGGGSSYSGYSSYIYSVKWDVFMEDIKNYIKTCDSINTNISEYKIDKSVS